MAEHRGSDLHAVNDNLRELIDSLRKNRERQQAHRSAEPALAAAPPHAAEPATPAPASAPARLPAPPEPSDEELRLRNRNHELELENQRLYDEAVTIAEQSTQLANLYVALARLHGSLQHAEVLSALEEIVISMIGSEEFAILEREPKGPILRVARGHGASAGRLGPVTLGAGDLGRITAAGKPFLGGNERHDGDPDVVACVPLQAGGTVIGAIVIFELLAHKPYLTPSDGELLEVLATHAANAMHLTARAGPGSA